MKDPTMKAWHFLTIASCLGAALIGCGSGRPQGRTGNWKFNGQVYEYTPDKLAGAWTDGQRTVTFGKDGMVNWHGNAGKYQFLSDGALLVAVEGHGIGTTSYKYTVRDNKLLLLNNQTGTVDELQRAD
jgi:hypothetical protein